MPNDVDKDQLYRYAEDLQALMDQYAKLQQDHRDALRRLAAESQDKDQMRDLALHDPLTGLPNRRYLDQHLSNQMVGGGSDDGDVYVLFLDLDRFKPVNDELGHDVGDLVLREVTVRLREAVRRNDVVARVGGDEFVVLLRQIASRAAVRGIAESIRLEIRKTISVGHHDIRIGVSIGCAHGPILGTEMGQLLKRADAAMYRAKQNGLGFAFFGDGAPAMPSVTDSVLPGQ